MKRNLGHDDVTVNARQHPIPDRPQRLPWQMAALVIAVLSVAAWFGIAYMIARAVVR